MKTALLILCACGLLISCNQAPPAARVPIATGTPASRSPGGAHIDKPFSLQIKGAECVSGTGKNAGDVAFRFLDRSPEAETWLKFTIGPLRDGLSPGQENNKPYNGPGEYTNVGISGKASGVNPTRWQAFLGYGTITVNSDQQSGTFHLSDGSASGVWDCGHKLTG